MKRIKPAASARSLLGATFLYLLDDRIEIGRQSFMFVEELERMSYRDVGSVTHWRTPDWTFLVGAGIASIVGIVFLATLPAGPAMWAPAGVFAMAGVALFRGRPGARLVIQIDDPYRSFKFPVSGLRGRQERVLADLVRRIRDARLGHRFEVDSASI